MAQHAAFMWSQACVAAALQSSHTRAVMLWVLLIVGSQQSVLSSALAHAVLDVHSQALPVGSSDGFL